MSEDPQYVADDQDDWPPRESDDGQERAGGLVSCQPPIYGPPSTTAPTQQPTTPRPKRRPRVDLVHFLESLTPQEAAQWLEHGHIRPLER